MKAFQFTIEMTSRALTDAYTILHNGDEHIGAKNSDEKLQRYVVDRVKNDNQCWWITSGDPCEYIQRNDPRFESGNIPDWFTFGMMSDPVKYQIQRYTDIYSPIGDKCLASTLGNHDFSLMKYNSRDVYTELWDSMKLPKERRFGIDGFLRLRFVYAGKVFWKQTIYIHHGVAGGRNKSAIMNELERMPQLAEADVYCLGHAHKKIVSSDEYSAMDSVTNRIVRRRRYYSATGSYVSGVSQDDEIGSWAERMHFYPQALGPIEIKFYPNAKKVEMLT